MRKKTKYVVSTIYDHRPLALRTFRVITLRMSISLPLRKPAVIGTAKGSSTLTFKKRNYQATVFATRYPPRVDIEEVKNDLEINLKTVTGDDHNIKIEKVETRYASYASFKITCICPNTAAFMNPNIWPEGVLVKWWKAPRNENFNRGTSYNQY